MSDWDTRLQRMMKAIEHDPERVVDEAINNGIYYGDNKDEWVANAGVASDYLLDAIQAQIDQRPEDFDRASRALVSFIIRGMETGY